MSDANRPDIAIIGVSALFPGSVDKTGFWHDILAAKDLVTDVPPTHWLTEDYYDPDQSAPDMTYANRGAFLGDVDFDALAWGIPPSIVPATDTSQLLALIVAHRVLEDAANGPIAGIDKDRMSCILGVTSAQELLGTMVSRLQKPVWVKALREHGLGEDEVQAVAKRIGDQYVPWQEATFPGLLGNVVAGRIANRLDLGGTNCVTDAACASTFSALQMGVNELYLGDSDVVIAGGVDTMNDIFMYMCFSKTPALSKSGDVRPFSDQADGTMLGEGLGMFALKRLTDAERDGDPIWAVIRGVGSSSDGRAKSVYAPLPRGQAKAIRRAYGIAGFGPETVELVEAHGTGTKAGDAAEFEGLKTVFDESGRADRQWCALGSVKSQVGHTKAAAGAAGLFKAVMAVRHKTLPPTIKVDRPNPKLALPETAFHINTETRPWVRGSAHARRAGVSSFGFGGSNFHIAVEEYTGPNPVKKRLNSMGAWLVTLTGADGAAVATQARELAADAHVPGFLPWLSHDSLSKFDKDAPARLALVATSADDLVKKLNAAADRIAKGKAFATPDGTTFGLGPAVEGGTAFLFPGQGSQYVGMGGQVAIHSDAAMGPWDAAADHELGGETLHGVVFPTPVFSDEARKAQQGKLTATEWAQPAIGVTSLSYLALVGELGLTPDAVAGHSYGEVTALHVAGVYDAETMVRIARKRGELMAEAAGGDGTMTAVARSAEDVQAALSEAGVQDVVLANHNHPTQVILSGPTKAIENAEKALEAQGLTCRRLPVATAFHSPVVASAQGPFRSFIDGIDGALSGEGPTVYANTTAAAYTGDWRETLAGQITSPVRWVELVEQMHADGIRHFVEVGPGTVLGGLVKRILRKKDHTVTSLDNRKKDGWLALLTAVGKLAADGVVPNPAGLLAGHLTPVDPRTLAKPKLAMPINGSNHGKPYPPQGGAAALPKPNPPKPKVTPAAAAPKISPLAPAATPAATPRVEAPRMPDTPKPPAPQYAAPQPQYAAPQPAPQYADPSRVAWIQAYQEAQRQAAQAHAAFQQAMADSHAAFLRAAETGFVGLATMVSGQPMVPAPMPTQFAAPPQPVAPAPMPVAAPPQPVAWPQPVAPQPVAAPPQPVAPTPMPVAAAPQPVTPAPVPVAAAPVAPAPVAAAPVLDLQALLLDVVADKTGYPADMLTLEMDLEGDLGVDSIKRVEILSAMQEKAPELPDVDPGEMAQLRTLGQIVEKLGGAAAAAVPSGSPAVAGVAAAAPVAVAPAAAAAAGLDLTALLLDVVADKTGYPADMLTLEMDLEGDLGVDSIKRVEILSAMQEKAPELPDVDPGEMAQLRTLGQIVDKLGGAAGAAPAATQAAPAPTGDTIQVDLKGLLLDVVADKTGYPADMLTLEMDLEGDLGVDSIKRVEILSAMQERAPGLPDVDPGEMAQLRTLGQIVDKLGGAVPFVEGSTDTTNPSVGPDLSRRPDLGRFVLEAVPAPASGLVQGGLMRGTLHVVDGGSGVATALVAALGARGVTAEAVDTVPAGADAVVFLGGLADFADVDAASQVNHAAFAVAKAVSANPRALVLVQDTGGRFGLAGSVDGLRAYSGGLAALARTAALEWTGAHVRAVDLERGGRDAAALAAVLADELVAGGPELEVGLTADGQRWTLADTNQAPVKGDQHIDQRDVVVVSGGARGVTAATVIALARASRARFVLLGRTALQDEPTAAAGATTDAELKKALLLAARAAGEMPSPKALGRQVKTILANREIRGTLAAVQQAGGQAKYVSVDVTDRPGIAGALDTIRAEWGPITGIIHGAGVLADKAIADKSESDFAWVFDTKIKGLRALLDATAGDPVNLLVMFSSVAARCGNTGQADYAMANEVLNKVAEAERQRRGGLCLVKSLGWGPWEGGMVTPQLKARFDALGVPLIPLDHGAQMLVDEVWGASPDQVELVLGGEPKMEALAHAGDAGHASEFQVVVSPHTHPWLTDHSIDGTPVVPVVLVVEWFARAAAAFQPGKHVASVSGVKVLGGVRLDAWPAPTALTVQVRKISNGVGAELSLTLVDAGGRRRYAATVSMTDAAPAAGRWSGRTPQLGDWADRDVYGDVLFHGPELRVIRMVEGASDSGIAAALDGVTSASWPGGPWATDVAAFDGGLQLALLWARDVLGGPTLPTGIGSVRLFTSEPVTGPLRGVLTGTSAGRGKAVSDIAFVDGDGRLVAEFTGVETHALPGRS